MIYDINIISHDNGVGLTNDIRIITDLLKPNKIQVGFVETFDKTDKPIKHHDIKHARVNIFIEHFVPKLLHYADVNILIPNPEWWWRINDKYIKEFDCIICKTKEAMRVFSRFNKNSIYTGFIGDDIFDKTIDKELFYLHASGRSSAKGSKTVFNTWKENKEFNKLLFLKYENTAEYKDNLKNVTKYLKRVDGDIYRKLQNRAAFHLCPSETEGFGHYLWEGMSSCGIVITTDAPPMNEIVIDKRFLAKPYKKQINNLGVNYYVSPKDLARVIKFCHTLKLSDVNDIGLQNRDKFLRQNTYFKTIFNQIISYYDVRSYK